MYVFNIKDIKILNAFIFNNIYNAHSNLNSDILSFLLYLQALGVVLISVGVVALGGAGSPLGAYLATGLGSLVLILCSLGSFASLRESYILSMVVSISNENFQIL